MKHPRNILPLLGSLTLAALAACSSPTNSNGDAAGNDATGNDVATNDAAGNDAAGNDAATNDAAGNDAAGNDAGNPTDAGRGDAATTPPTYSCSLPPTRAGAPDLPRETIDTTMPPAGRSVAVHAGDDLQAAINAAQPGDTLMLDPGAEFSGTINLPAKTGTGWVVIRTAASDSAFPPPGTRVTPADAAMMPRITVSSSVPAISTSDGAHHYRFIGIEFAPRAGVDVNTMLDLGSYTATDASTLAHHIVIDRCYVHGDPTVGGKRGIQMNSAYTAVIDSYVSDWKHVGQDTQAIGGWNGPGPYKIVNNYLEGAGENILFGGADAVVPNQIPSDMEICHNHFFKPLSWKVNDPSYAGTHWSVKNLFELKTARRVLLADNVFENCWGDAQTGYALVLKSANQGGSETWAVTEHVTVYNNLIRHAAAGININGADPNTPVHLNNVRIENNLLVDIGGTMWAGDDRLFQILSDAANVSFFHNTGGAPNVYISADGAASPGFVFEDNVVEEGMYGLHGSGAGDCNSSLQMFFPGAVFDHNVIIGGTASACPAGNFFPADDSMVPFVDAPNGNFRLAPSSMYRGMGSDGTDPGVNQDRLEAAISSAF